MVGAPAPQGTGLCLLLSVGRRPTPDAPDAWHARVMTPGGQLLDFDSPFELLRFLVRLAQPPAGVALPPGSGGPGLR